MSGALNFAPYVATSDSPPARSVPVTALVLSRNEEANISRCVHSLEWCDQVIVVDSGSTDRTVELARQAGAAILANEWAGFAAQRQWALQHSTVVNDWIYFVDADEWTSAGLAREVAAAVAAPTTVAFEQRFRLIFQGRWIAHCGWYDNSWITRLFRRESVSYDGSPSFGERPVIDGPVGRLSCDLVDEDLKGLAAWLRKHVSYAEDEADRRQDLPPIRVRARTLLSRQPWIRRPRSRAVAKDIVFPLLPFKALALFLYMYVVKAGWRDGRQGLLFCCLHAWFQLAVGALIRERQTGP